MSCLICLISILKVRLTIIIYEIILNIKDFAENNDDAFASLQLTKLGEKMSFSVRT